jgi:hypothetical protein
LSLERAAPEVPGLQRSCGRADSGSVTSFDNVLRAFKATRPPHDDILARIVCAADRDDRIPVPITLALVDGTVVRGSVASDMSMAEAVDEPLREQFEAIRARSDISPEQRTWMDGALPSLGGRGIGHWLNELHKRVRDVGTRVPSDSAPLRWTDLSEEDVMTLATFADRSAITIRDATIEREGAKKQRQVPMMRVQFSAVASWWVGNDA